MEHINTITSFINHERFFEYHGLTLSFLWVFACSFGILLKRFNIYLHALSFFVIDVVTLFFITGAWIRLAPHIDTFPEWTLLKKAHIIGGSILGLLLVSQHLLGVKTLLSKSRRSRNHVVLAWVVTNFARVVAYFGWVLGSYHDKKSMANYTLVAAVVLFILSTGSVFFGLGKSKPKIEAAPQKGKKQ